MYVDPKQIFAYLVQRHGVSPATAAGILANIKAESNFSTTAVGDGGTSGGLFQHHKGRWSSLKAFASRTNRRWDDWTAQVDFAIHEAKGMGINLQNNDPVSASKEWTIRFERPANMYKKADQRARNVGLYTRFDPSINYTAPTRSGGGSGNAVATETQEQMNVPDGGTWYGHPDGGYVVVYPVGDTRIFYRQNVAPSGKKVWPTDMFVRNSGGYVDGGTTDGFRGVAKGTTWTELVDQTLFDLGLAGSPALADKGVMAIVALAMTRELSPTELANRLRQTEYWNSKTDKEREWDDLSDAEKDQRIQDAMSQLNSSWFTYVGEDLAVHDYDQNGDGLISSDELRAGNPELYKWSERVASGKATVVTAVNTWMKEMALDNEQSPWARRIREEEQAQGQFGVDVSNMAGQIQDMYSDWGVEVSDDEAKRLANAVVMNEMSIEDVETELKEQANGLYPNKPPDLSTSKYAQPFKQVYMNMLETGEPDLFDDHIQAAISQGMNLADFRKALRQDDRWMETKNARDEVNQKVSQLGRVMGF